jgi:hypothetical protein
MSSERRIIVAERVRYNIFKPDWSDRGEEAIPSRPYDVSRLRGAAFTCHYALEQGLPETTIGMHAIPTLPENENNQPGST